jgi:hypothetical protein
VLLLSPKFGNEKKTLVQRIRGMNGWILSSRRAGNVVAHRIEMVGKRASISSLKSNIMPPAYPPYLAGSFAQAHGNQKKWWVTASTHPMLAFIFFEPAFYSSHHWVTASTHPMLAFIFFEPAFYSSHHKDF